MLRHLLVKDGESKDPSTDVIQRRELLQKKRFKRVAESEASEELTWSSFVGSSPKSARAKIRKQFKAFVKLVNRICNVKVGEKEDEFADTTAETAAAARQLFDLAVAGELELLRLNKSHLTDKVILRRTIYYKIFEGN